MTTSSSQSDSRVFVDTGAYYALTFNGDKNHSAATSIFRYLTQKRYQLFTTNFVLAETHALILNRLNRDIALRVLEGIYKSHTQIIRLTPSDENRAMDILRKHKDKDFSFTDATSFVVMERLGINTAFAFDRHFDQYGLTVMSSETFR